MQITAPTWSGVHVSEYVISSEVVLGESLKPSQDTSFTVGLLPSEICPR